MPKPTIAIDFDGVLHSYESGWQGVDVVADGPVLGAMSWLTDVMQHFEVVVFSARSRDTGGVKAMRAALREWLARHEGHQQAKDGRRLNPVDQYAFADRVLAELGFPTEKPAAFVTIDDRAIRFDGTFEGLEPETLVAFQPWYKRQR